MVTGWTLEEFDRQPFPFVLELIDHWAEDPPAHRLLQMVHGWKVRRPRQGRPENENLARAVGLLPTPRNTVTRESSLPPWVRTAREMLRDEKAKNRSEGKKK